MIADNNVPYATPLMFNSYLVTKITLKIIFKIENRPTAKLETLVFCKPTKRPVMI